MLILDERSICRENSTVSVNPARQGWPEKAGLNELAINSLAFDRSRAIQDYVIKFGIPVERLVLGTSLPRCRECKDTTQIQNDNQVVFSLTTP